MPLAVQGFRPDEHTATIAAAGFRRCVPRSRVFVMTAPLFAGVDSSSPARPRTSTGFSADGAAAINPCDYPKSSRAISAEIRCASATRWPMRSWALFDGVRPASVVMPMARGTVSSRIGR